MKDIKVLNFVPNLTQDTVGLVECLWNSYKFEYCHNYKSLEAETEKERDELKKLLEPLKKLGLVYTAKGLMTEEGEVAGSGFQVNGREASNILELALYRYHYNDRPYGRSEDYVPTTLNVAGYTYKLVKEEK